MIRYYDLMISYGREVARYNGTCLDASVVVSAPYGSYWYRACGFSRECTMYWYNHKKCVVYCQFLRPYGPKVHHGIHFPEHGHASHYLTWQCWASLGPSILFGSIYFDLSSHIPVIYQSFLIALCTHRFKDSHVGIWTAPWNQCLGDHALASIDMRRPLKIAA